MNGLPRDRSVILHSHRDKTTHSPATLAVRNNGDHVSLRFERFWTAFNVAMSAGELAELRDAITYILDDGLEQTPACISSRVHVGILTSEGEILEDSLAIGLDGPEVESGDIVGIGDSVLRMLWRVRLRRDKQAATDIEVLSKLAFTPMREGRDVPVPLPETEG